MGADKVSISIHSSVSGRANYPVKNDDVLEEILRYAPKEEDTFFNGLLSSNRGQDNVANNVNGVEICAHTGLIRENKE